MKLYRSFNFLYIRTQIFNSLLEALPKLSLVRLLGLKEAIIEDFTSKTPYPCAQALSKLYRNNSHLKIEKTTVPKFNYYSWVII